MRTNLLRLATLRAPCARLSLCCTWFASDFSCCRSSALFLAYHVNMLMMCLRIGLGLIEHSRNLALNCIHRCLFPRYPSQNGEGLTLSRRQNAHRNLQRQLFQQLDGYSGFAGYSMDEQPFRYDDLICSTNGIRLVSFHASENRSATIECDILHARLSDCPRYEALSYLGGIVTDTMSIIVSGTDFKVGPNLHFALLQLRDTKASRVLWIDAICL
jgi:hypothetical protein